MEGTLAEYSFHVRSGIRQCYRLFLPGIIEILRGLHFFNDIGSKMEVFQHCGSAGICSQVRFYQIPFTVDFRSIGCYNICSRIDVIHSALLPAAFITEGYTIICYIRSGQHFPFFIDGQFPKLLLIWNCNRSRLVCHQVHVIRRSIQAVSGWSRDLF